MMDLEPEYVEGLKIIAFSNRCTIEHVIGQVASHDPPDLGVAVRWFVWDFFVNRRHMDRERPWHRKHTTQWRNKFYAAPEPTRHQVLDYRKFTGR